MNPRAEAAAISDLPVAIDCLGGDHGIEVTVNAAIQFLKAHRQEEVLLFGPREEISSILKRSGKTFAAIERRCKIIHNPHHLPEDISPAACLRQKQNITSMHLALEAIAEGRAKACLSAGNTGALIALAGKILGKQPGIDRPAICTAIAMSHRPGFLIDTGAISDASPARLVQFAQMGSEFARHFIAGRRPSIALLNIGSEKNKGNRQVRETDRLLRATDLNYIGFIESNQLLTSTTDVIVCDGFTGNIALKASEGTATFILRRLMARPSTALLLRLFASEVLETLDIRRYNGAVILGVRGLVGVSHGAADSLAFFRALEKVKEYSQIEKSS